MTDGYYDGYVARIFSCYHKQGTQWVLKNIVMIWHIDLISQVVVSCAVHQWDNLKK